MGYDFTKGSLAPVGFHDKSNFELRFTKPKPHLAPKYIQPQVNFRPHSAKLKYKKPSNNNPKNFIGTNGTKLVPTLKAASLLDCCFQIITLKKMLVPRILNNLVNCVVILLSKSQKSAKKADFVYWVEMLRKLLIYKEKKSFNIINIYLSFRKKRFLSYCQKSYWYQQIPTLVPRSNPYIYWSRVWYQVGTKDISWYQGGTNFTSPPLGVT